MVSPAGEALALVALLAILGFAITRPRGLPEAVVAIPAACVVIAAGAIRTERLLAELSGLLPVVAFLAAVLVISELCGAAGLFRYAGAMMARASRGSPPRLLGLVFVVAAVTTAVLSLDATVVLLTPVVFATASRVGVRPRPHVYATTHLANAGSLLLPVSNLTNLLAVAMLGIGFVQFAGYLVLPWLVVLAVEYAAFRWYFAGDLRLAAPSIEPDDPPEDWPSEAIAEGMPTTRPCMSTSAPPELPGLMAASVWITGIEIDALGCCCEPSRRSKFQKSNGPSPPFWSSSGASAFSSGTAADATWMLRSSALTIPSVRVLAWRSGAPMAITRSPTLRSSESPHSIGVSPSGSSTLSTARSTMGSSPTISAL